MKGPGGWKYSGELVRLGNTPGICGMRPSERGGLGASSGDAKHLRLNPSSLSGICGGS